MSLEKYGEYFTEDYIKQLMLKIDLSTKHGLEASLLDLLDKEFDTVQDWVQQSGTVYLNLEMT